MVQLIRNYGFTCIVCILSLMCLHNSVFGQPVRDPLKTITGRITDSATGAPIQGVMVTLLREQNVKLTDINGYYKIDARSRDTLMFSHISYNTVLVPVGTQKVINISLQESTKQLDDVVVIAYGKVRKSDLTGSVGVVNVDDVSKAPVPNLADALGGRIAGMQVSSNDGQPGNESNIVIRGGNSITQSNAPLYVVDGFPMDDFSMSSLNPDDVASISILKDASATAIYGSRGANGVIIIETKRGINGKPQITYNTYLAFQKPTKKMALMSPYEFVKYQLEFNPVDAEELYLNRAGKTLDDYKAVKGIDWQSLLLHVAPMHNHNISVRGGTGNTKISFSGNLIDQKGVMINSGFNRYQGRLNLEQKINKDLILDLKVNYSNDRNYGQINSEQASGNNSYATYIMYRMWGYRPISTRGNLEDLLFDDDEEGSSTLLIMNPFISTKNEFRQQIKTYFTANIGLDYQLPWDLKLNIRGGYSPRVTRNEYFNNSKTYRGYPGPNNSKGVHGGFSESTLAYWMNENTLTLDKRINKYHRINTLLGWTVQGRSTNLYAFEAIRIPVEHLRVRGLEFGNPSDVTSSASYSTMLSYLGRVNYNFKSKYLLTASLRADGSSRFLKNNRWGYFPSFAFAWNINKEPFFKRIHFIDDSKLRFSWGTTGNNGISDFAAYTIASLSDRYGIGTGSATPDYALIISNFGNRDLKWETTRQFDFGFELSLFKRRVNIEMDYYNKVTKDLLLNANVPYSTGYTKIYKNIGSIQNTGFEISISTTNVQTKSFQWNSAFNISFNQNKILSLTDDEKIMFTNVAFTSSWNSANLYVAEVGKPVASFYGLIWDGVYQIEDFDLLANGTYLLKPGITTNGWERNTIQPGDIKYKDINGDLVIDDKDKVVIGRGLPKHFGGFNNNFSYKNFSLNIFIQWNYGNHIMNANRIMFEGNITNRRGLNQFASYEDRWSFDNQDSKNFRTRGGGPVGYYSTKDLEDGSFVRLKTVQISYTLPRIIKTVKSIELNVSAQNLYTWTKYTGIDPEVSTKNSVLTPGFDYSAYPRNLTLAFGLKINL